MIIFYIVVLIALLVVCWWMQKVEDQRQRDVASRLTDEQLTKRLHLTDHFDEFQILMDELVSRQEGAK